MALTRFGTVLRVALLALLATTIQGTPTSRIIGGESIKISAHAASLRLGNVHICGGTIIGLKHILTAAHCVVDDTTGDVIDSSRLSVRVGSANILAGGRIHDIEKVIPHPDYYGYKNDIAVLTLTDSIVENGKTNKVEISKSSADQPPEGANVVVAGWGQQSSTLNDMPISLQEKTFTVASGADCLDANENIDDSNLCLAHNLREGSCTGDAGNGGMYNNKLIGVCSFVVGSCGSIYPDVFVDISYYSAWIEGVIAQTDIVK